MPDTRPSQIMNDEAFICGLLALLVFDESPEPRRNAGRLPCFSKTPDWFSVVMKDRRTIETPPGFCPLNDCSEFAGQRQQSAFFVFGQLRRQAKALPRRVQVLPLNFSHLSNSPAGIVQKARRVFEMTRQLSLKRQEIRVRDEALSGIIQGNFRKRRSRVCRQLLRLYCKPECARESGEFEFDGA